MLLSTILVTNTDDGGAGSLRDAILIADDPASGVDRINFAITGAGVHTIAVLSALPTISRPITIDGYSQPGASPNTLAVGDNAVLQIELNGTNAGPGVGGPIIASGGTTIRGLVINRFSGAGISVAAGPGDAIVGNFLGTDPTGTSGFADSSQIGVQGFAPNLTIGGTATADRNVMSSGLTGIDLRDGTGVRIINNYIGVDRTGTVALGNRFQGIYLAGGSNATVGGTTAAERNVISGGRSEGLLDDTAGNLIEGNYIGTNASGNAALGNSSSGLVLDNGGSTIGGATAGAGNLISGNTQAGIEIHFSAPTAPGNVVQGNRIGTDATGTFAIANGGAGVDIGNGGGGGYNNTIGGTTPAARNIVSGNVGNGISSSGTGFANVIVGNYVGVDVSGLLALPNGGEGVDAYGSSNITIGGTATGAGNVIAANKLDGILVFSPGVVVQGNLIGLGSDGLTPLGNGSAGIITFNDTLIGGTIAAARNVIAANGTSGIVLNGGTGMALVQGNYIGTDASGLLPRGNAGFGVLANIAGNTIGGADAGAGNVIAANGTSDLPDGNNVVPGGINIQGVGGNLIQGNLIGLGSDGLTPLGNRGSGVVLRSGATNNIVRRNTIAFNATDTKVRGAGVVVIDNGSIGNVIDANSIFSNTGLGIDLGNDGVTRNTAGSPHSGANNLQSFPVLTSVSTTATDTVVVGTLSGAPNTVFTVQFFRNTVADPSGFGEGQTFLGEITDLATNADGFASFTVSLRTVITAGQFVSATATDSGGNTSEFSQEIVLAPPPTADLRVSISPAAPNPALTTQNYSYTVTVTNDGPQDATNVVLDDSTGGAALVAVNTAGTISMISGAITEVTFATLAAGATATATFTLRAAQAGTYIDTVTVRADQADSNSSNNSASVTETVIAPVADVAPVHVYASLLDTGGGTFAPFITWGYPVTAGLTRFRVYRFSGSGGEVGITDRSGVSAHNLIDRTARPGSTYTYRVTAVSGGMESPQSAGATVTIPGLAPRSVATHSHVAAVTSLYRRLFNRTPSMLYLKLWAGWLDAGVSLKTVAQAIRRSQGVRKAGFF